MLYIPKIDNYLKILTDVEVEDFVVINFCEYFKSIRKELYLGKVANSFYIFLTTADEVEKYVPSKSSDNNIHHYSVEMLTYY